jgi:Xaa-Pro dipeptidase
MNAEGLDRLQHYLQAQGAGAALLASPFTLTWLTGYAPSVQTGPNPFEGGPALAWFRDGRLGLILSNLESGAAQASGAEVREYEAFTADQPLAGMERQAAALRELLAEHATLSSPVAVEMDFLPAALLGPLQEALPRASLRPADEAIAGLRAVKTPEEIEKIRASLALCDLAQKHVRDHLRPGVTELELWGGMKARLEAHVGERLPILADLAAGARTAEVGGPPGNYVVQAGDPLIFDVVPRLAGYWGDNCATPFAGEPSAELAKVYGVVRETLSRAIEAARPGRRACDLDALARGVIRDAGYEPYPHHTGHGLGVSYHEQPRLVASNTAALEPGMVVALEPGIYLSGLGGVRLEHVVLVTDSAPEVLTHHLPAD